MPNTLLPSWRTSNTRVVCGILEKITQQSKRILGLVWEGRPSCWWLWGPTAQSVWKEWKWRCLCWVRPNLVYEVQVHSFPHLKKKKKNKTTLLFLGSSLFFFSTAKLVLFRFCASQQASEEETKVECTFSKISFFPSSFWFYIFFFPFFSSLHPSSPPSFLLPFLRWKDEDFLKQVNVYLLFSSTFRGSAVPGDLEAWTAAHLSAMSDAVFALLPSAWGLGETKPHFGFHLSVRGALLTTPVGYR